MPLSIILRFSEGVSNVTEPSVRDLGDSLIERRLIKVNGSLAGKRIDFVGLQATITDVLVRVLDCWTAANQPLWCTHPMRGSK